MNETMKSIVDRIDEDSRSKAVNAIADLGADAAEAISSLEGREALVETDRIKAALAVMYLAKASVVVYDSDIFSDEEREIAEAVADEIAEREGDLPDEGGLIGIAVVRM